MKQITLEESKGKTVRGIVWSDGQVLIVYEAGMYAVLTAVGSDWPGIDYEPSINIEDFNVSDMARLGFTMPDTPDAQDRAGAPLSTPRVAETLWPAGRPL